VTQLEPYDLRCEHRAAPLGIDEPRPRLSWRLRSGLRGDRQRAYRLVVEGPGGTVWDTGWCDGDAQSVDYAGPPLASRTRYAWTVEVGGASRGLASPAASWFETALLDRAEWVAHWIGEDSRHDLPLEPPTDGDRTPRTLHLRPCPHLRRPFDVASPVVSARAYVSARGLYRLSLNGVRVGDAELAPGWTEYRSRIQYDTYDVTRLVHEGENVVGAVIADGWWCGYVGMRGRRQGEHYGTEPALLLQLVLEHADGSRTVVASDGSWREQSGPIRYSDLLMGEYHDARLTLGGWDAPGFDDSSWRPVRDDGPDTAALVAASDEPVRVTEDLPALSVVERPDGAVVVDLGQNMVGRVRLTVRGAEPGARVQLRHGEVLDERGDLYTANLRTAEQTDVYRAAGESVEVWEPAFTFHGFRYVELRGYPGVPAAEDVVGRVLESDLPAAGAFSCSDEQLNRLWSNIRWSQRGNFVSIPTDCPQRDERLGWLADAQVFLPTACLNADVAPFFARWMRDVVGSQRPDGAFVDVVPNVVFEREAAPGWGDGAVIVPWQLYRAYGDVRVLERSFDAMTRWVDWVERNNPDLRWRNAVGNHYGDWLQVDARTPRDVLATAYFARSAQLTSEAAGVLGRGTEQRRYASLAERIRTAFVDGFVRPDGSIEGGTQTAYLLALGFDLLPPDLVPAAVEHLAADIEGRGTRLTTGFLGVALLCPVLAEHGRADLAYGLLHGEEYPSWGYSIRHGATTLWERWDGWTAERGFQSPAMNSFNHYSLGAVGQWLYEGIAGIRQQPGSVGYRELLIRPTPGGRLSTANASYESVLGRIATSWERVNGELHLHVAVPPGSTALVHVPTSDPDGVREGGRALDAADGIAVRGYESGALVCAVGPGTYDFVAAFALPGARRLPTMSA
jgi:alpha-L-rhamnosidase